jgi:hypothetical protein
MREVCSPHGRWRPLASSRGPGAGGGWRAGEGGQGRGQRGQRGFYGAQGPERQPPCGLPCPHARIKHMGAEKCSR